MGPAQEISFALNMNIDMEHSRKQALIVRIVFGIGAIIDGLMLVPLLSPAVTARMFGIQNFNPGADSSYASMIAASLMAGWTVLLVWAAVEPLKRRGILLLTCVPVLAALILSGVYAVSSGFIEFRNMLPTWVIQFLLLVIYISVYLYSSPRPSSKSGNPHKTF